MEHPIEKFNRSSISNNERQKMFEESLKPVSVNTLNEIRMVINYLQASKITPGSIAVKSELSWYDDKEQRNIKQQISVNSEDVSLHSLIISGLDIIKRRMEAFSKIEAAIEKAKQTNEDIPNTDIWKTDNMKFSVDLLIERRLGGKRNSLRIRWEIPEGVFEYDPYLNKLYQMEEEDANKTANFKSSSK